MPKASVEVTVDVVIFTIKEGRLHVLLNKRANEPFRGEWALPGGFLWEKETTVEAANRILKQKTEVKDVYLEQLFTFDEIGRDPRGQILTVAYFALVPFEMIAMGKNQNFESKAYPVTEAPKLAFDHSKILKYALKRLRSKLEYTNVAYSILPSKFTLTELQKTYEIILGELQDKRNFRRKYENMGLLEKTEAMSTGAHRPAKLYRFKKRQPIEFSGKAF